MALKVPQDCHRLKSYAANLEQVLSATRAADLDKELMSDAGFSLDQLMELAGLSVSEAVYRVHPPEKGKNILVACGPGNNGTQQMR